MNNMRQAISCDERFHNTNHYSVNFSVHPSHGAGSDAGNIMKWKII